MNATLSGAWAYRVAIIWFCLFSINALCTAIVVALVGCTWIALDFQSKFIIIIAIVGNWTGTIMAFVSKSAKKIEETGNPLDITQITGDTTFVKKTDVSVAVQTTDTTKSTV